MWKSALLHIAALVLGGMTGFMMIGGGYFGSTAFIVSALIGRLICAWFLGLCSGILSTREENFSRWLRFFLLELGSLFMIWVAIVNISANGTPGFKVLLWLAPLIVDFLVYYFAHRSVAKA